MPSTRLGSPNKRSLDYTLDSGAGEVLGGNLDSLFEGRCFVGLFPGELGLGTAEMAAAGGFAVDRPTQVEVLDDPGRGQREELSDQVGDLGVGDLAGAEGVDVDADRLGNADGVGELNLASLGQAGGDDVLGDVAGHVGGRAVDLRGVLAAESAAAVAAHAAVGVDDDLAAGHAGVAVRTADDELAGRVDVRIESCRRPCSGGKTGRMTCSLIASRISAMGNLGACWVETTTVSTRTGLPSFVFDR